ncbi:MAG: aminotransferase class V-fold PLP-dependent enzyme, partial [Rhodospirillaceae bacterium]|nr:aminotransferase class V-fold PLP-dependent enzyme [Rhodospirillaceae bacterium]
MNHNIYMDYNATAPVLPEAKDAVVRALDFVGNPSSVHRMGRLAHRLVEDSRVGVRALVNAADGARVIFTSGGTEANAICLLGCGRGRIIASAIEHPAVRNASENVELIAVNKNGIVDASHLEKLLSKNGEDAIVSVMLANNETGVIQPVKELAEIAHNYGALFHCDAVQAAGKIEIDFTHIAADYMSISAHKFGGPKGVGALITKPDAPLRALVPGGGQENGLRGGTENVSGIAGMACAANAALGKIDAESKRLLSLRDDLEKQISKIDNTAVIIGGDA